MSIETLVVILFICYCLWNLERNVKKAAPLGKAAAKWGIGRWLK